MTRPSIASGLGSATSMLGADPRQEQTRQVAVGQFLATSGHHVERVRPITPDVLRAVAWVRARQRTEREQPRHKAQVGIRVARGDELRHLVERGEVAASLGRALSARGHRDAGQIDISDQVADGHEPVSFTLHGLYSMISYRIGA